MILILVCIHVAKLRKLDFIRLRIIRCRFALDTQLVQIRSQQSHHFQNQVKLGQDQR